MWSVPKIWKNGTCVIIGGGPSLIKQFDIPEELVKKVYSGESESSVYSPYMERLHSKHVIAVNMSFKIGDWMDMIFYGDAVWGEKYYEELMKHPALIVSCLPRNPQKESILSGVKYLTRNHQKVFGITTEQSKVSWNNNSGSAAINFAVHLGVKKIILLGFDMSLDSGQNQHWHKYYATPKKNVAKIIGRHLLGFPDLVKDLHSLGVEVINCSQESKIEGFPKMNLKDVPL